MIPDVLKFVDDFYCSIKNGGGVRIEWEYPGPDGAETEIFLRAHGVRVWGRKYPKNKQDTWGVTVRKQQAKMADGLLRGRKYPVTTKKLAKGWAPQSTWGVPAKAQGMAGMLVEALWGSPKKKKK